MKTLHIKVKNKETYQHLLWFLNKLDKSEISFIESSSNFSNIQEDLKKELNAIDTGESDLMDLDQFDKILEDLISKNED